jgi:hypothetical protein
MEVKHDVYFPKLSDQIRHVGKLHLSPSTTTLFPKTTKQNEMKVHLVHGMLLSSG